MRFVIVTFVLLSIIGCAGTSATVKVESNYPGSGDFVE